MKRIIMAAMLLLALMMAGCTAISAPFDPETEGVVDVIVRRGDEVQYYAVSSNRRVQETPAFAGDAITVYEVDNGCFDTYLAIDEDGRSEFVSRLADVCIWDDNGDPVPRTPELMRVLMAASWLEHDLFTVRILCDGEDYFLSVELNVNWWSPCALYWYDPARNGLVELYELDSWETVGLRVRDLSRLAERPVIRAAWLVSDPLRSFCGGRFLLRMQGDVVNLVSGDDVIVGDVTGCWSVHGRETGFVSAAGYHVLDEATGEIVCFADLGGMPEDWAERFAHSVTELRFARRPGAAHNPLKSWCGGQYQLRMEDGSVNLVGPDGLTARRVTGYWSVSSTDGSTAGVVSADGYHVLNDDTGEWTAYTCLSDMPDKYAEYFAEDGFCKMNRFPFAYGLSDFSSALAELQTLSGENRALLDGLIAAVSRQPEWLAGTNRIRSTGVLRAVREWGGWSGSRPDSPDWQQIEALFAAMRPRYVASEHGAVYLHFAIVADNGRGAPARLYYAPEAATAELCRAGWTLWEGLGGGWYLAALTE